MTVVFGPDTFTVASDIGIALYPSGNPQYAYNLGSGTNLTVNAANDRVQSAVTSTDLVARCTAAGLPTGDQQVTATCLADFTATDNEGSVAVRLNTSGTANGYVLTTYNGSVFLYRLNAGAFEGVASAARTYTNGAQTFRLKATGTSPVVLEGQVAGTAVITYSDSGASLKASGVAGLGIYNATANTAYVDDFQVDDLVAGVTRPAAPLTVALQAVARAATR